MTTTNYQKLNAFYEAITVGDKKSADYILGGVKDLIFPPAANKLFEYLLEEYRRRFSQEFGRSVVTPVLSEVTCGRRISLPDETGARKATGGCRLRGKLKMNRPSLPLVTIITVVYNGVNTVEETIKSVIAQIYPNIEYVIIDGGSSDGTLQVIQKYEEFIDYYVSEPDSGIYSAINKGLSVARGDYIAILNGDDFYLSGAVSNSIDHILTNNLDLSYASFFYADENGVAVVADEGRAWDESMFIQGIPGGHETVFAHKDCYNIIGGYDESFRIVSDYDWLMRAFRSGFKARPLNKNILVMRTGGASFSDETEKEENFQLLRRNFGILEEETLEKLYHLKYYKNWQHCNFTDSEMLELLTKASGISADYHRSLFLTIDSRKQGIKGTIEPAEKKRDKKIQNSSRSDLPDKRIRRS